MQTVNKTSENKPNRLDNSELIFNLNELNLKAEPTCSFCGLPITTGMSTCLDAFGALKADKDIMIQDFAIYHADCMIVRVEEEIKGGETDRLEFKSSTRGHNGEQKDDLEKGVVKTICGFLNNDGGKLLIGVDDESNVIGLEKVYNSLGKRKNRDGLRQHLRNIIIKWIGEGYFWYLKTEFHEIDGKDISETVISKSSEPVFTTRKRGHKFYVRDGTSTEMLSGSKAEKYIKHRFTS